MKPTNELKKEHQAIKLALRILGKMAENLESGDEVNPDDLESMIDFIKTFADKCHHTKEEKFLYPIMGKIEMTGKNGPISVMLAEHDMGREYVKKMGEGIQGYKKGDMDASFTIAENARGYISLLNEHIEKEDNILFPMLKKRISKKKEREISAQFNDLENNVIGAGKHEEFHRALDRLKKIYL